MVRLSEADDDAGVSRPESRAVRASGLQGWEGAAGTLAERDRRPYDAEDDNEEPAGIASGVSGVSREAT